MRFCPNCGSPLLAGAKFCVECGRRLDSAVSSGGESPASAAPGISPQPGAAASGLQLTNSFLVVFFGILIVGLATVSFVLLRSPTSNEPQVASAPPSGGSAPGAEQGQTAPGQLPPGHPTIKLPTEARTLIDKMETEAKAKPSDVAAWAKLGNASMRAAMFDPSYYQKAADAFAHVLKLDPDNLDALRGIRDIDYDRKDYDQAVAAYEHYLKKKPDDAEVRTDLGTMYLSMGNPDQAIVQYKKALKSKPDLFQAYFNLGVAYGQQGDKNNAAIALTKAVSLASDDEQREETKKIFAQVTGMPADEALQIAKTLPSPSAHPTSVSIKGNASFQSSFEDMAHGLPVAGQKVVKVVWEDKYKAELFMDNFPMDQMPPFAKDKFLNDLKSGIDSTKSAAKVTDKVQVNIVDAQSGRVMQTVNE